MKHWTAALKEKKLLLNFFKRLRLNETERYKEFQYISLCGRERNFVRCLDRPFVFNVGMWKRIIALSSASCPSVVSFKWIETERTTGSYSTIMQETL